VGVTLTAAIILIIGGMLHAMQGVVGLATNEFYVTTQKWIFQFDLGMDSHPARHRRDPRRHWPVLGRGLGPHRGRHHRRDQHLRELRLVADHPLWALVIIVFDFFVIWALTAQGRDVVRSTTAEHSRHPRRASTRRGRRPL
jgi:hypothetical protein